MKFQEHTSDEMVELYQKRPFQGQSPEKAKIIFVSSDANYSPDISVHPFFELIKEYQRDGISFWNKYGCHHPFMLPSYPFNRTTAGVPFHRNFSRLGLDKEYAEHISFIELLNIPTIGNKSEDREQFYAMLCFSHLQFIERLMLGGGHKLFYISNGVLKDLIKIKKFYPLFDWINWTAGSSRMFRKSINENEIREMFHFSSYKIHSQLEQIKAEIDNWLRSAVE